VDPYTEQASRLAEALAQIWNVPYVSVEAEYLERSLNMRTGQTLAWMIEPAYNLLKQVDHNLQRAQQGIIFINAFDRVASKISVNSTYASLSQQLDEITKGQKLFLPLGNGYQVEFKTEGLLIVLAGAFLPSDKRLRPTEQKASHASLYEPSNLLPYLLQEFSLTPKLIQSLVVVPMDTATEELDLRRTIQDEVKQLLRKYKDIIEYTGIEIDHSVLDYEQVMLETSAKPWKIAEIRTQLESKLLQQIYRS
jgi:ATP-dependent protease Clp ATPase subunit